MLGQGVPGAGGGYSFQGSSEARSGDTALHNSVGGLTYNRGIDQNTLLMVGAGIVALILFKR